MITVNSPLTHMSYVNDKAAERAIAVYQNRGGDRVLRCKMGYQCVALTEQNCEKPSKISVDNITNLCPGCLRRWPEKADKLPRSYVTGHQKKRGFCAQGHNLAEVGRTRGGRCIKCKQIKDAERAAKEAEWTFAPGLRGIKDAHGLTFDAIGRASGLSVKSVEKYGALNAPNKILISDVQKLAAGLSELIGRVVEIDELTLRNEDYAGDSRG